MTYDDLIELLEPVGIPVVGPGHPTVSLPAITIEPVGMATADGYSWLYDECEIKVLVPINQNNPEQFDMLRSYTVDVWRQIWGTKVEVDEDGPLFGEMEYDPPALFFQLSARFPSDDLCVRVPSTPRYLTDIDGDILTDNAGNRLTT